MGRHKSAEVIVGLSPQTEGRNRLSGLGAELSMTTGAAVKTVEIQTLCAKGCGRYPCEYATEAASVKAGTGNFHEESLDLLTAVLDRSNMKRAYDRVLRNKGAPGVDGMTVGELKAKFTAKQHVVRFYKNYHSYVAKDSLESEKSFVQYLNEIKLSNQDLSSEAINSIEENLVYTEQQIALLSQKKKIYEQALLASE